MTVWMKKIILTVSIAAICLFSFGYWVYNQFYISTNDAYVNANIVQIAARVTGIVNHLYVTNNQYVKENEKLFDLDPAIYYALVDQAKASLAAAQAKVKIAELIAERTSLLVKKNAAPTQQGDIAQADLQGAIAQRDLAQAALTQAELNAQYTFITAPTSGWVTNVTLREGQTVTANQPQFALVSDKEFWLDANFKETDLAYIHAGQKAKIKVDMYPGHAFNGIVQSVSSGAGNAFSLLPPENATGNWVKVTQRVPVRIQIINPDRHYPLRVGTSATATIRLRSG